MGRVINPDTGGKQRKHLTKYIQHACQVSTTTELSMAELRDRAAFVYFSLIAIDRSINTTVAAWERRDFWVKADKFRHEWSWVCRYATKLKETFELANWDLIIQLFQEIRSQLTTITLAPYKRLESPWVGAWEQYIKIKNSRRD